MLGSECATICYQPTEKRWRTFSLMKCYSFTPCERALFSCLKTTVSGLKFIEDCDNEEVWKSAVNKRKFLFDRILKEYDPPELSGPKDNDDDTQTEKQQQTVSLLIIAYLSLLIIADHCLSFYFSKENNDQVGGASGGSSKLNASLVSPSEQMALRAKDELFRKCRKRGSSGFTPEDLPFMTKCVNCILSYLVMFILENNKLIKDEMMSYLFQYLVCLLIDTICSLITSSMILQTSSVSLRHFAELQDCPLSQ